MITANVIDFTSRECKSGSHLNCSGKWNGLGFEIFCNCKCGHKKASLALESVGGPVANAIVSSFQEDAQNDYT